MKEKEEYYLEAIQEFDQRARSFQVKIDRLGANDARQVDMVESRTSVAVAVEDFARCYSSVESKTILIYLINIIHHI
jgi:hypothetical protein